MTNRPISLFPINVTKTEEKCLLPAAATVEVDEAWSGAIGSKTEAISDFNWLTNKSFTSSVPVVYDVPKKDESEESTIKDTTTEKDIGIEEIKNQLSDHSEDDRGRKKKKRDKKSKSKSKKKKKERKRSHSPSLEFPSDFKRTKVDDISDVLELQGKIFLEDIPELLSHRAWRMDRQKDKLLWTYESLPQQNISNYRLSWRQCLGCKDFRNFKSGKGSEKLTSARYYQKTERKKMKFGGVKVFSNANFDKDVRHSYLPISHEISDNLSEASSSQNKTESQEVVIEGNTSLLDENSERTAYYNKRLQSESENIDLWLEFIKFQDKLFSDLNNRSESVPTLAVIEKKLSILEKALEINPSSLKLKFAQLEIGKTVWEEGKIDREWETLLNRDPSNFIVMKHYLLRKQCDLSKFQVSEVIGLYSKCFYAIGLGKGVKDGQNQSKDFIELLHQYLGFLNQCGHIEKAVASFQAVMEFNLFCPEEYRNCDVATCVEYFEDFWNSMVPRFGEDDAKGWKFWSCHQQQQQPLSENQETNDKQEEAIIKSKEKCKAWFEIENLREAQSLLPWRPDIEKGETEDNCQDLDSLVLFDDINFVLFIVEDEHALLQLMLAFFDVMGLVSMWQKDLLKIHLPFLNTSLEFRQYGLYELNQLDVLMDESNMSNQNRKYSASLLQMASNVLKTAFDLFSNEYSLTILTLLWIHLQILESQRDDSKNKTKILKKSMKNILKEDRNRNNIIIWNAYVKVLQMLGKNDEALNTAELALTMTAKSCEPTDLENYGSLLLCQTYCQILLNASSTSTTELNPPNLTKISNSLKCISEKIPYDANNIKQLSSVEVLKIKRNFQSMINNYFADLYLKKNEMICYTLLTLINCAAIFDYVMSGLTSAMFVFDNAISESEALQSCDVLKENLFCVQIDVIKFHMSRSTLSLELLRRTLTLALKSFPNNVRFLKDFVELEERSNISCRRRRYFDASVKELTSPTPVIFAVLSEMRRQQQVSQSAEVSKETGISNRIRSLFERGLQSSYCQHTPLIWRLYIHFEVKMNQMERSKGIFYRSLQQCPAVKVLYMDAIKLFGDEMLQQMVDLMIEKEIRVHLPTEEMDILFNSDLLDTATP